MQGTRVHTPMNNLPHKLIKSHGEPPTPPSEIITSIQCTVIDEMMMVRVDLAIVAIVGVGCFWSRALGLTTPAAADAGILWQKKNLREKC